MPSVPTREELVFRTAMATLPAGDIDRAGKFYAEVAGFEVSPQGEDGSIRVHVADTSIMVYPSTFAGTNQATAVGIGVEDIGAAVAYFKDRGVAFEEYDFGEMKTVDGVLTMPDGSKGAWFKDTEGNIIGLFDGEM
jgi:predicted enzyme related to lactoylglutathione lyase